MYFVGPIMKFPNFTINPFHSLFSGKAVIKLNALKFTYTGCLSKVNTKPKILTHFTVAKYFFSCEDSLTLTLETTVG